MAANNTTLHQHQLWTSLLSTQVGIAVTALILNAAILIKHILQPSIITHFTVYLLVLYLANVVFLLGVRPIQFSNEIQAAGQWSFGLGLCVLHTYFQRVFSVIPVMSHLLIATDRFWALQFPHAYRHHRTIKTSLLVCAGMICYVHCFALPAFIVHLPFIHAGHCQQSPQLQDWFRVENMMDRFLPLMLILGIYVYIFIKRWRRRKPLTPMRVAAEGSQGSRSLPDSSRRALVRPFVVLTLTTLGVAVCWLPLDVFFFCKVYLNYAMPDTVAASFTILFTLQSVLIR
ncbi:trace amine-associated receptor 13c-like [Paramacrobiotus metropolitanus]|uniref:trace amine-associated receptor 13c-like n=1 Tax=Paramacrobiotus metropolitanus TaxID=2943436 RepID=UPI0024456DF4|nr:trace amine-associated receptor 13c-like [Paramacrobiotus metropolitanus]